MTPQPAVPVLVVGEALIDIVQPLDGPAAEHVGGSPANVAKGLARLGHSATLATHIGSDDRGRRIEQELLADGVHLSPGSTSAARTPTATATLNASGAATYVFDLAWQVEPDLAVPAGGHLHTGSIAATLQPGGASVLELAQAARPHATVSYDPNARPAIMGDPAAARGQIEALVALADVVKVSDEDLEWLYGAELAAGTTNLPTLVHDWHLLGASFIVMTRGAQGAVVSMNGASKSVPPGQVTVVDTVGAGDSFMAGLISGLLDLGLLGGAEAREHLHHATLADVLPAVHRAIECANITVSRAGANPPTRAELPL